jgi:hypothetical protein
MAVSLKGISMITIKGDKGDVGASPSDSHLRTLIVPLIPEPIKGEDGKNGRDGHDGKNGVDGRDGVNGNDGVNGMDGNDGSPDTPDEVVEKVNTASKKIKAEQVQGMTGLLREVANYGSNPQGHSTGGANQILIKNNGTLVSAHVTELDFTTGMSLTYGNNGKITVTATGGSGLTELTATGTVDSSNTTFTFLSQPTYIVSDHLWYKINVGWTWDAGTLTATMSVPPADDIWGFS